MDRQATEEQNPGWINLVGFIQRNKIILKTRDGDRYDKIQIIVPEGVNRKLELNESLGMIFF